MCCIALVLWRRGVLASLLVVASCAQPRDLVVEVEAGYPEDRGAVDVGQPDVPQAVRSDGPLAPLDAGADVAADRAPPPPPPPSSDAGCGGLLCEYPITATDPRPLCAARPLKICWLYVTQYPSAPAADIKFCDFALGGSGPGLAWEATGDYVAFLTKWRPHVCKGRAQLTSLTLEVLAFDDAGATFTRNVTLQACP